MPITRFLVSLTVLSAFPVIATAQSDNPTATVPKPTIADVQKVVQTISGDRLKAAGLLRYRQAPRPDKERPGEERYKDA